jgi:hypothetical protein
MGVLLHEFLPTPCPIKFRAGPGTTGVQVTRGGAALRVSSDGQFLYYAKGRQPAELWRDPSSGGDEVRIVESIATTGSFAVTKRGLYFVPAAGQTQHGEVMFMDSPNRSPTKVAHLAGIPMWGLTVSPGERYIIHSSLLFGESDLMLVEGFR